MDSKDGLICLCYVSTARRDLPPAELEDILSGSIIRNEARNITGLLCVSERNFIQFLEGDEAEVLALFDHIAKDPRHSGCLVLYRSAIETRAFADWSMALRRIDQLDPQQRELFLEIESISLRPQQDATSYQKQLDTLFRSFIRCMSQSDAA